MHKLETSSFASYRSTHTNLSQAEDSSCVFMDLTSVILEISAIRLSIRMDIFCSALADSQVYIVHVVGAYAFGSYKNI